MTRRRYVVRLGRNESALYATGSATWTRDRKRAFVFEDRGQRRGFDNGLTWARAHAKALAKASADPPLDAYMRAVHAGLKAVKRTCYIKPSVVRLKRKYKPRSATVPYVKEK